MDLYIITKGLTKSPKVQCSRVQRARLFYAQFASRLSLDVVRTIQMGRISRTCRLRCECWRKATLYVLVITSRTSSAKATALSRNAAITLL